MWNIPSQKRLDAIPRLYETEGIAVENKLIHLHFYIFSCDWYIVEYDGDDLFFGYAILNGDLQCAEWGYISFNELKSININGVEIDCEPELSWRIRPASIGYLFPSIGLHLAHSCIHVVRRFFQGASILISLLEGD